MASSDPDPLQIPSELVENVARSSCVLFLGADAPCSTGEVLTYKDQIEVEIHLLYRRVLTQTLLL